MSKLTRGSVQGEQRKVQESVSSEGHTMGRQQEEKQRDTETECCPL